MKLFILCLLIPSILIGAETLESSRPFLKRLKDNDLVADESFELPFLIVTSAYQSKDLPADVTKKTLEYLSKTKTAIRARFSLTEGAPLVSKDQILLPNEVTTGDQLEGIKNCNKDYCAVKLMNDTEKSRLSASTDKLNLYKELLFERLIAYLRSGDLRGYEDRASNNEVMKSGFDLLKFLPEKYPKMKVFLYEEFLKRGTPSPSVALKNDFLRLEVMNMIGPKMQPVLRLSEVMQFEENDATVFFEPQIYTNHFFDSSFRFFEILSYTQNEKKSLIIETDVMEIDELKKSGLIRALFKGQMAAGVRRYQEVEFDRIFGESK